MPQRDDASRSGAVPGTVRALDAATLARIRGVVRSLRGATRTALATAVCRELGWRRPTGALPVRACRDVLVQLEERGELTLPPRRRRSAVAAPEPGSDEGRDPAAEALPVEPVALREVVVRPVERGELPRFREEMARHHYLGDGRVVGESVRHVAEVAGRWVALLAWGAAALKSRHREAWVGWDVETKHRRLHLVTDNVRFLVLPSARVPHLASAVLARSVRRLSGDFEALYGHPVLLAETFVDVSRFRGTCYLAAGWRRLGETRGMARKGRGYHPHGRKKALLVYGLEPRARELLRAPMLAPQILRRTRMATLPALAVDVNALPLEGEGGLVEVLRRIVDPRHRRGTRHKLEVVLALAVTAALSGMRSFEAVAQWAADLPLDVRKRMGLWCWRAPSESTFRRVLQPVDADEVDRAVGRWLAGLAQGGAIALDGKTLKGSRDGETPAVHLLAAITHGEGVVVAQRNVGEKTNEIPEAKPLLADLDLEGEVVTADAMHTQWDLAEHLVGERGADYVLVAKGNQPTLEAQVAGVAWGSLPPSGPDD